MSKEAKNRTLKKKTIQDTKPPTDEKGYLGLNITTGTNYGTVMEDKRADFTFPTSIATYQYMSQHPIIAASNNLLDILIGKVDWSFSVPDSATGKQKEANKMLNFFMNNMDHSWKSFINEVLSYKIFGFHVAEKVWKEVLPSESKKFAGKFGWKRLATRSQTTIQGWDFDEKGRYLKNIKQNLDLLTNIYNISISEDGLITLPTNKCLLFSYKQTRGNPEGHSPLKDCYQSWSYIKTLESYEAIGRAKQLGGVPVMGIDATWLAKAQSDSTSSEASVLDTLQTNMENLHAGEQTYMIIPLAYTDSGKSLFDFRLLGIDGGTTQDNTRDIIVGKQLEMMMIFLTDILRVGNENHGSFSLAESKQNLTSFGVENHLQFIVDVIQEQLVPQTLIYNGFNLPKEQHPKLTYSDLDQISEDSFSKLVQRIASVNMLPKTREVVDEILEKSGFKYRLSDGDIEKDNLFTANTLYPEIFSDNESGAGEGMKEGLPSGTGKSLGNNSEVNVENAE